MKNRMIICFFLFTVCLFYLSVPNVVFGQSLAKQIFNRYPETFKNSDVQKFFPSVLRVFQDQKVQNALSPAVINRIANSPTYIRSFDPNVDDSIVVLLTVDTEFNALFKDEDFHAVLQNPTLIEELAKLIEVPIPTSLEIISGNNQYGMSDMRLPEPFVVEVRDQNNKELPDIDVEFRLIVNSSTLSDKTAMTDQMGQALVTFTLGSDPGIYQVEATVDGFSSLTQTFTAAAGDVCDVEPEPRKPTTLAIVSGNGQKGQVGVDLRDKFVVEVRDQYGDVLPRVMVNFDVTAGDGSFLLATAPTRITTITTRTHTNGQTSVTLILGSGKGENRVEARVVGVSQTQTFTAEAIDADVNGDGVVNIIDLSIVLALIGQPDQSIDGVDADINDDDVINYEDLPLIFSVLEPTAAAPSVHALVQGGISAADLRVLLTQAKALPEIIQANPVYRRSIVEVERLLAILTEVPAVPKQSALLVNYPNPFNPETWIPYQLSEASDVTVDIYALNGSRVRTLALGHRTAGLYQRKSRAAYWDGRNEFGEPVASGVYFYTLTAGDFTATRKMLIRK